MSDKEPVTVDSQMLIQRPVSLVFEAFVNPEVTTKFWFTKSSGRLELGKRVRWDWEMFGVGDNLIVKAFEQNKRILIEWESDKSHVEWIFELRDKESTLVKISSWGFSADSEEILTEVIDAKGGYTIVLAGLKAWLEHGIQLNLIIDQFPDGCPN